MTQLGLDGHETTLPITHRPLSARQRELVVWMRTVGVVRPVEVGRMMHAGRKHSIGHVIVSAYGEPARACCKWASSDGWDALRRLERHGLVERIARGKWRIVEHDESSW